MLPVTAPLFYRRPKRELKYERCVLRDGRDMFVIRFSIFNKWEALRYGVPESVTKVCNYLKMEN